MGDIRGFKKEEFFNQVDFFEKIKLLLNYAILAPSTHNSQPWLFKIKENSCEIYADLKRRLPEADPLGRDLHISLGCCVENLVLAARRYGIFEELKITDNQNQSAPTAEVFFAKDVGTSGVENYEKLLLAMRNRFNARGIFSKIPVDHGFINNLSELIALEYSHPDVRVDFLTNSAWIKMITSLTRMGIERAYKKPKFRQEMSGWVNHALSGKPTGIPSRALRMPFLLSFVFPKLIRFFNLGRKLGKLNEQSLGSAPVICVISAKENSIQNWLRVGMAGERLMLECVATGLRTSIFVAAIEMGLGKKIQELLKIDFLPQFLFAIGHMQTPQKPTPREEIVKRLVN